MRLALVNHFKSTQALTPPKPALAEVGAQALDLKDIKGQGTAKQALEVTAAGGHNLLTIEPPELRICWPLSRSGFGPDADSQASSHRSSCDLDAIPLKSCDLAWLAARIPLWTPMIRPLTFVLAPPKILTLLGAFTAI